jgi:hypothetical protein
MAIRYSGALIVRVTWSDRLNLYNATVSWEGGSRRIQVGAPAYLRVPVDSPEAYDATAKAAISFADDECRECGIGDMAEYDDSGVIVRRSPTGPAHARAAAPAAAAPVKRSPRPRSASGRQIGTIGDVNFPEYDGGPVFDNGDGTYSAEYVEIPSDDLDFTDPNARWTVYRVDLDQSVPSWGSLNDVARSAGQNPKELKRAFESDDPMQRAWAYVTWAGHYGWHEFDSYPLTLTCVETAKRYDTDLGCSDSVDAAVAHVAAPVVAAVPVVAAAPRTFAQSHDEILDYLASRGWSVKKSLKVPHATSPDGRVRLWFKPQAVYFTNGTHHELGNARSIFVDTRALTPEEFLRDVQGFIGLDPSYAAAPGAAAPVNLARELWENRRR